MHNKKGIKLKSLLIMLVLATICLAGIAAVNNFVNQEKELALDLDFYFVEKETSLMKTEQRQVKGETKADILGNVLTELKYGPKTEGLSPSIPQNVSFNSVNLDNGVATVDISSEYSQMKTGDELLCRGSIVWTLTGIDFVEYVNITVDGNELTKTNGEPIGNMNRDDILIDAVISPEPTNYETVKLYFSNTEATGLEAEERKIEVNPNEPLEKYVMEQLIVGPTSASLYATVPAETKLRTIKTSVDGICYVDLSSEFVSKHSGGSTGETLTIYSIVNTLTSLDNIKMVQFLIEGEKQQEFKGHIDFSKPFEPKEVDV